MDVLDLSSLEQGPTESTSDYLARGSRLVDYFLGTAFTWKHLPNGHLSVHLTQSAFMEFPAHRFGVDCYNLTPNMSPYRSGYPIDSIPPLSSKDLDLKRRTKVYQGIVGSINY